LVGRVVLASRPTRSQDRSGFAATDLTSAD